MRGPAHPLQRGTRPAVDTGEDNGWSWVGLRVRRQAPSAGRAGQGWEGRARPLLLHRRCLRRYGGGESLQLRLLCRLCACRARTACCQAPRSAEHTLLPGRSGARGRALFRSIQVQQPLHERKHQRLALLSARAARGSPRRTLMARLMRA